MKSISTKELQRLLSLYLDGALDEEARNRFEEYLESNPDAAMEFERWKKQQQLLKSKPGIQSNEWFWQKLSIRLEQQKSKPETVYPFSRKYVPLAASLTVLIAAFGGMVLFQQRSLLTKFFSEEKEQVQQLYQGNILQGKLIPLFTNLDKDQVLQFALFGTLPLDAQAKTALRVDESKENGTRIEFAKNETRQHPPVTVEQFCRDIDATPAQHRSVDSILSTARDKIQESVFLGENKSLAGTCRSRNVQSNDDVEHCRELRSAAAEKIQEISRHVGIAVYVCHSPGAAGACTGAAAANTRDRTICRDNSGELFDRPRQNRPSANSSQRGDDDAGNSVDERAHTCVDQGICRTYARTEETQFIAQGFFRLGLFQHQSGG